MRTLSILYGLPGSGKTTFAEKCLPQNRGRFAPRPTVKVIDFDKLSKKYQEEAFARAAQGVKKSKSYKQVIIDGLFTTNAVLEKLIGEIKKAVVDEIAIEIHWWQEDREACLWNDRERREQSCEISIKNLPLEEPKIEGVKIIPMTVVRKPLSRVLAPQYGIKDRFLKSSRWCLGGTCGNYTGEVWRVEAEQPVNFVELDNLLMKICPNLSFLQYKNLTNECVRQEQEQEYDYYGGTVNYGYMVCDLDKLFDKLQEWGYVDAKI